MRVISEIHLDESLAGGGLHFAAVWGHTLATVAAPDTLPPELSALIEQIRATGQSPWRDGVREAVRNMLRFGKYKPTGRGKPASEFLLGAAKEDAFPSLNVPANINNFISLSSGLPISVFDADRVGDELLIRRGLPGEKYVFNPSGQEIDLQDLLCVCRKENGLWIPTGNPVKDSMETKITVATSDVVALIYAPNSFSAAELEHVAAEFAHRLRDEGGAQDAGFRLFGA